MWKTAKKVLKKILIGFIFIFFVVAIFTWVITKETPYTGKHPETVGKTISFIMIDGLSKSIFEQLLAHDSLPNIQSLLNRGTYIKNGIVSFPSMTGFGFYPFLTGMSAENSGIYGLRWFDRSRENGNLRNYVGRTSIQMNEDIVPSYKTLFEWSKPYYTTSINSYMDRGVADGSISGWSHVTSKYQKSWIIKFLRSIPYKGKQIAKNHFEHEEQVLDKAIDQLSKNPKVQWITFIALDAYNHIYGTDEVYLELVTYIDKLIGEFLDAVDSLNQQDERIIAIISDHGVVGVSQNLSIVDEFERDLGLNISRGRCSHVWSSGLKKEIKNKENTDGYFVINGDLTAYLYFRDPNTQNLKKSWETQVGYETLKNFPSRSGNVNIVDFLVAIQGVDLVMFRITNNKVAIHSGRGNGYIIKEDQKFRYEFENSDPLKYGTDSISISWMKKGAKSSREWLEFSAAKDYPDAIPKIFNLLTAPFSPDIILCSKPGYDFGKDFETIVKNFKGGHGGLRTELMTVPFIISGPGISITQKQFARSEDIGATALNALGIKPEYELDGKILD